MENLKIRNIVLGEGIPKICVPLTGKDLEELRVEVGLILNSKADLIEWRADYYRLIEDSAQFDQAVGELRCMLANIPMIFTYRSVKEGGQGILSSDRYLKLIYNATNTGAFDLIDLELSADYDNNKNLINSARQNGLRTILSSHDFNGTPSKEKIIEIYEEMKELNCDIPKIAVMANSYSDVLTLLDASNEIRHSIANGPFIMISMGDKGSISRIGGGFFGSSVTFGSLKEATAPGQLHVDELYKMLQLFYCN